MIESHASMRCKARGSVRPDVYIAGKVHDGLAHVLCETKIKSGAKANRTPTNRVPYIAATTVSAQEAKVIAKKRRGAVGYQDFEDILISGMVGSPKMVTTAGIGDTFKEDEVDLVKVAMQS